MRDYFTKLGIEEFTNKVADKVIERGAEKIAEHVVHKIRPLLSHNNTLTSKPLPDKILTRKEAVEVLQVSESTLRKRYGEGELKVYGSGTPRMRFKSVEVFAALEKL